MRRSLFLLPLHLSCSRSSCAFLQLPSVVQQRSAAKPTIISALPLSFTTSSSRDHFPYNDGGVETTIRSSSSSSSTSLSARRNRNDNSISNRRVEPSDYVKQRLGLTDDSSSKNGRRGRRRPPPPPPPLPGQPGRGMHRNLIQIGDVVLVIQKNDQRSGVETRGVVLRHLTSSSYHPRGIKVMLASGQVGRVTKIVDDIDPGVASDADSVE